LKKIALSSRKSLGAKLRDSDESCDDHDHATLIPIEERVAIEENGKTHSIFVAFISTLRRLGSHGFRDDYHAANSW